MRTAAGRYSLEVKQLKQHMRLGPAVMKALQLLPAAVRAMVLGCSHRVADSPLSFDCDRKCKLLELASGRAHDPCLKFWPGVTRPWGSASCDAGCSSRWRRAKASSSATTWWRCVVGQWLSDTRASCVQHTSPPAAHGTWYVFRVQLLYTNAEAREALCTRHLRKVPDLERLGEQFERSAGGLGDALQIYRCAAGLGALARCLDEVALHARDGDASVDATSDATTCGAGAGSGAAMADGATGASAWQQMQQRFVEPVRSAEKDLLTFQALVEETIDVESMVRACQAWVVRARAAG